MVESSGVYMKKTFSFLSLVLSLFLFLSCSNFSINKTTSIVIYFDSANHSKAVTYNADDVSYFVVSIEPKVQDDIKVDIAAGEISAEFSDLKVGTYKIKVSAFREDERKIAYGNSGSVYVNAGETTDVPITMKFLSNYSTCVVGDIILNDGTACTADEYVTGSNSAVAVIVRAAEGDTPALGVGIVHNKSGLAWCTSDAVGKDISIADLTGTRTSGYMNGRNGWDILKAACSDAEEHPEYYPAWNYSLTYAATNNLTDDLAEGWYLPTIAELYTIYENIGTVDDSLLKAGGDQFDGDYYMSCSQINDDPESATVLGNVDDETDYLKTNVDNYVCSVRVFN